MITASGIANLSQAENSGKRHSLPHMTLLFTGHIPSSPQVLPNPKPSSDKVQTMPPPVRDHGATLPRPKENRRACR